MNNQFPTIMLDGRKSGVTDALGRPARDFADFAHDAAASNAWRI